MAAEKTPPPAGPLSSPLLRFPFLKPSPHEGDLGLFGPYRITELLGEGGMGFVFRGLDDNLQRPVALKVMRPEVAQHRTAHDRFLREGRAAASIKSDYVVTIYQVGEVEGVAYLAMEFLAGRSLEMWLRGRKELPGATSLVKVARDVLRGLAAAHAKGLIHRDIKPANLWVELETGRVKLLDFGLTRIEDDLSGLTESGAVIGTPGYLAPEQAVGDPVDQRADLFSLGVVLYRLATGKNPFHRGNLIASLGAVSTVIPPSLTEVRPDLPYHFAELIDRMMAKSPAERPQTAKAAFEELSGEIKDKSTPKAASPTHGPSDATPLEPRGGAVPVPPLRPAAGPPTAKPTATHMSSMIVDELTPSPHPGTLAHAYVAPTRTYEAPRTHSEADYTVADGPPRRRRRFPWKPLVMLGLLAGLAAGGAAAVQQGFLNGLGFNRAADDAADAGSGANPQPDAPRTDEPPTPIEDAGPFVAPMPRAVAPMPRAVAPKLPPPPAVGFGKLDPKAIPAEEFDHTQPKELVGLIGSHFKSNFSTTFDPTAHPALYDPLTRRLLLKRLKQADETTMRYQVWEFDGPTPQAPADGVLDLPAAAADTAVPIAGGRYLVWIADGEDTRRWQVYSQRPARFIEQSGPIDHSQLLGAVSGDGRRYIALVKADDQEWFQGWDVSARPRLLWSVQVKGNAAEPGTKRLWVNGDGTRFTLVYLDVATEVDQYVFYASSWRATDTEAEPLRADYSLSDANAAHWRYVPHALSPDGTRLACTDQFAQHCFVDCIFEPKRVRVREHPWATVQLDVPPKQVRAPAFHPNNRWLAFGFERGVVVLDLDTSRRIYTWDTAAQAVNWVGWSADGTHLLAMNANRTVYVLRLNALGK